MVSVKDVFVAINDTLRALFPGAKVYKERIKKLDTPSLSVELVSISTPQHSKHIINKKIDLDIIYFAKNNEVGEALEVCDKLMSAFSIGMYVRDYTKDKQIYDKRYIHCLQAPEYKLIDQDLHFLVKFEFADEFNPSYLNDRKEMKDFNKDTSGIKLDEVKDLITGKKDETEKKNQDFVKDVDFKDGKQRKAYEEEGLKYMDKLSINYKL